MYIYIVTVYLLTSHEPHLCCALRKANINSWNMSITHTTCSEMKAASIHKMSFCAYLSWDISWRSLIFYTLPQPYPEYPYSNVCFVITICLRDQARMSTGDTRYAHVYIHLVTNGTSTILILLPLHHALNYS